MQTYALVLLFFAFFPHTTHGRCPDNQIIPGEYLVRIQADSKKLNVLSKSMTQTGSLRLLPTKIKSLVSTFHYVGTLNNLPTASPEILSVEPDCWVSLDALPNDPRAGEQWNLRRVDGFNAFSILPENLSRVRVAVVDSGVDYRHEDLAPSIAVNTTELSGIPGYDDDQNGCRDDVYGCDIADKDGDPMAGTRRGQEHGTHVAGILAATVGNERGIAGVSKVAEILPIKGFSDSADAAKLSDLIASVYYATHMGAKIINCSWGGPGNPTQAERDAFLFAVSNGTLPVVAGGNEGRAAGDSSPAGIPEVLTVGSSNSLDQMSAFSNYGPALDVLAPGGDSLPFGGPFDEKILSLFPTDKGSYGSLRGSSMAVPIVSGIAATIMSINPRLNVNQVIEILKKSGDQLSVRSPYAPESQVISRVNAYQAIRFAKESVNALSEEPNPVCTEDCFPAPQPDASMSASLSNTRCGLGAVGLSEQARMANSFLIFILLPFGLLFYRRKMD